MKSQQYVESVLAGKSYAETVKFASALLSVFAIITAADGRSIPVICHGDPKTKLTNMIADAQSALKKE